MPATSGKGRILLLHLVLFGILCCAGAVYAAVEKSWMGVDEAVVEKIAKEHGRVAAKPLIDPGEGDLLLFLFLAAGVVGGFAAGYFWRDLTGKRPE